MRKLAPALFAALLGATPLTAQDTAAEAETPGSIVAASAAEEWVEIPAEDLLIMELAPDADGPDANSKARTVVIQLLPRPFSQPWVENIRSLAKARWWDGTSIYRSVDNWVVQWGGGDPDLGFAPPAVPPGIVSPTQPYEIARDSDEFRTIAVSLMRGWANRLPASHHVLLDEYAELVRAGQIDIVSEMFSLPDPYSKGGGFYQGWPFAMGDAGMWPVHCYGHVGVARDLAETGTGSELYAVIGHAPRQLDRNIAVVGRVIDGMEHLSVLPRGTGEAGVYESRTEDTPIVTVKLASEHPMRQTMRYQYLDTASASFERYLELRGNRKDAFYTVPAGGVDLCNVHVPVRPLEDAAK